MSKWVFSGLACAVGILALPVFQASAASFQYTSQSRQVSADAHIYFGSPDGTSFTILTPNPPDITNTLSAPDFNEFNKDASTNNSGEEVSGGVRGVLQPSPTPRRTRFSYQIRSK